jgi:putative tricarboxylic transport membrane protein
MSRDAIAGLAVLAASLVLFALTLDLKPNPLVPIGPGFYPRIVLGLTALLAAALVAFDLRDKKKRAALPGANYAAVALHFAVFGVYVVALPWLGFRVATFAYVVAANALMAPPRNFRQWGRALVLGLVTALVTYYIFEHYLHVLLPRGRWTDF